MRQTRHEQMPAWGSQKSLVSSLWREQKARLKWSWKWGMSRRAFLGSVKLSKASTDYVIGNRCSKPICTWVFKVFYGVVRFGVVLVTWVLIMIPFLWLFFTCTSNFCCLRFRKQTKLTHKGVSTPETKGVSSCIMWTNCHVIHFYGNSLAQFGMNI